MLLPRQTCTVVGLKPFIATYVSYRPEKGCCSKKAAAFLVMKQRPFGNTSETEKASVLEPIRKAPAGCERLQASVAAFGCIAVSLRIRHPGEHLFTLFTALLRTPCDDSVRSLSPIHICFPDRLLGALPLVLQCVKTPQFLEQLRH